MTTERRGIARVPPPLLVLGAAGTVQVSAAVARGQFDRIGPAGIVFLRVAFGALILVALWRPRVAGRDRRHLAVAALFGLALAGMNLTFYEAIDRIPLGIAVTIEFAGPLAVAIAGSRRRLDLLWVVLAAGGIVLLARGGGGHADVAGVAFALAAACFWASYILLSQRVGRAFPGGGGLALAMVVGGVALVPFGVVGGGSDLLGVEPLAVGLAVALMGSVIPYSLELEALRRLPARVFGILLSLDPVLAALAGLAILGQELGAREVFGIALVVGASVGATATASEKEAEEGAVPLA